MFTDSTILNIHAEVSFIYNYYFSTALIDLDQPPNPPKNEGEYNRHHILHRNEQKYKYSIYGNVFIIPHSSVHKKKKCNFPYFPQF